MSEARPPGTARVEDRPARCAHRFPDANVWLVALCDVDDRWPDGLQVLNGPAVHAAKTLRSFMSRSGYCYPSVESLARRSRVEERAVQRAISTLEHAGWLVADRSGGRSRPGRFWTAVPGEGTELADRLVGYLDARADRDRSLPMLAEALAAPSRTKGGVTDALCTGHPAERLRVAAALHGRTDFEGFWTSSDADTGNAGAGSRLDAKGVTCDPKGDDRDGGSTTEDPSPLPIPSPSRRPGDSSTPGREGSHRKPTKRRDGSATPVADALGQDFPRFREFLASLADRLDRADEVRGDEGSRLHLAFRELDRKAELALTVCQLVDRGWEPLLWQTLTDIPHHGSTAYTGCRNPAAAAARRVFDLALRLEEQGSMPIHTEVAGDAVKRLGSGPH